MNRLFLVCFTSFLFTSSTAFAQTHEYEQIDKMFQDIVSERSTPIALAKFEWIRDYSDKVSRRQYANLLEAAYDKAQNPLLKFRIYRSLKWIYRDLRDPRALEPSSDQGCLTQWNIVGPFDNPNMDGFDREFGPEFGEQGPYQGRFATVDWREVPQFDARCIFDLDTFISPSTSATVYLSTQVETKRAHSATLLVGSASAYRIWVNGAEVANKRDAFGTAVDGDGWDINLKKGANHVVVKLATEQDGALELIARLVDTRTFKPIAHQASPSRAVRTTKETKLRPSPKSARGAVAKFAERASGDQAAWTAALWAGLARGDASTPWRALAERTRKESAKVSTRALVQLAFTYEQHWERAALLKEAADRNDQPLANAQYAVELRRGLTWLDKLRAKSVLADVAKQHPNALTPRLEQVDWELEHGVGRLGRKLFDEIPASPSVSYLRYKLTMAKRYGSEADVAAARRELFDAAYVSGGSLWSFERSMARAGEHDRAIELVQTYRKWVPSSRLAAIREARLWAAKGDDAQALKILQQWSEWAPGDASLYEQRAEILVRQNKMNDAIKTLEKLLVYHPQNQQARDRLTFMQPDEVPFYNPWIVTEAKKFADRTKTSDFSYDTIVDQSVTQVESNGLSSQFVQLIQRPNTQDGIDAASAHRIAYQGGDEEVEIIRVVVHKSDGSISEEYDEWDSGSSRKASTTYNDTAYVTVRANDVQQGDLVEFRYRVTQVANENFRGDYFGDIAYLQGSKPIGFQRYALIYPDSWELFFRAPKLKHEMIENRVPDGSNVPAGFRSTSFTMNAVPHVETDPQQPGYSDIYDYVLVSNKKTYNEVGIWWWNLIKEQLIVDEEIRKKVAELSKGKSEADTLKAIHNYVVKNTRYLHVGLGIHGWKPYRTTTCFRNRFGDCKDKAALLKVMLEEAGIDAEMVLVRTRRLGDVEEHPASMHIFNHAITYVPKYNLFLDGTAEFNGTSELTSMDQGARALIVKDGGKTEWVKLPIDKSSMNKLAHTMEVDLRGDTPVVSGKIVAHGTNAVFYRQSLQDPERRDENFEKQLAGSFPGATLKSAKYTNLDDLERPTVIEYQMTGGQLKKSDGDREYLLPAGSRRDLLQSYAQRSTRTQDLVFRVPFMNETRVRYVLKNSATIKRLPSDVRLTSKFGGVKVSFNKLQDGVAVDVDYSIDVQRVKVEDYEAFRDFLTDATNAINASIDIGEDL